MDIYFVEYKFAKKLLLPKFVSTPYEAYQMKYIVSSAKYSTLNNFNYIYLDFTIIACLLFDLNFMCFIFYSPHPMSWDFILLCRYPDVKDNNMNTTAYVCMVWLQLISGPPLYSCLSLFLVHTVPSFVAHTYLLEPDYTAKHRMRHHTGNGNDPSSAALCSSLCFCFNFTAGDNRFLPHCTTGSSM